MRETKKWKKLERLEGRKEERRGKGNAAQQVRKRTIWSISYVFRCAKAPLKLAVSVGWLVGQSVGRLVGRVTHSFEDPHGAPYWPIWPCLARIRLFIAQMNLVELTGEHFTLHAETARVPKTNKAGYTATPVTWGWAGAIFEVSKAFGQ